MGRNKYQTYPYFKIQSLVQEILKIGSHNGNPSRFGRTKDQKHTLDKRQTRKEVFDYPRNKSLKTLKYYYIVSHQVESG